MKLKVSCRMCLHLSGAAACMCCSYHFGYCNTMASPAASIYVDEHLLDEKLERELLPSHQGESSYIILVACLQLFTLVHFLACFQRYNPV